MSCRARAAATYAAIILTAALLVSLNGCSEGQTSGGDSEVVRLGFFPNVTHAPALLAAVEGYFEEELGDVELATYTFNAGTEATEALFSGALDLTFIGPNPAINAFAQSEGTAVRIVAGTTSGGAALVVREGIDEPADLVGARLATPSLANTQDVALRAWLIDQGLSATLEGAGDVSILPQSNAQTLQTFRSGDIDGAWVPEPWATRLVLEGGGHVLVDERDIWPDGDFVTTHLMVSTDFLTGHPDQVSAVLRALIRGIDFANDHPVEAQAAANGYIEQLTGLALSPEVIATAWGNLEFTLDPIASSLQQSADDAVAVGLLKPVDLNGVYALDLLNEILREQGRPEVHE
ncbi:MAG: aliphatic sulfonate ABC transporter substrate-binding protein [Thermoleophilia bacterium]|nr:aliphatic sulfonate ABC transporter substrate-binding protein [Thermoleophilia bacterium]